MPPTCLMGMSLPSSSAPPPHAAAAGRTGLLYACNLGGAAPSALTWRPLPGLGSGARIRAAVCNLAAGAEPGGCSARQTRFERRWGGRVGASDAHGGSARPETAGSLVLLYALSGFMALSLRSSGFGSWRCRSVSTASRSDCRRLPARQRGRLSGRAARRGDSTAAADLPVAAVRRAHLRRHRGGPDRPRRAHVSRPAVAGRVPAAVWVLRPRPRA